MIRIVRPVVSQFEIHALECVHQKCETSFMSRRSGHESMTGMGYVSRAYDKLPDWVELTLGICAIAGIVYGVARYGWVFLLKVIFSP
jgi:hypothetical protein